MNASIILILIGAVLLLVGNLFWFGLGLIAVGVVVYSFPKRGMQQQMFLNPAYQRIMSEPMEEPPKLGFQVRQKTPEERMGLVQKRGDVVEIDKNGIADIPLPVPDYLKDYVDMSFKKKVK